MVIREASKADCRKICYLIKKNAQYVQENNFSEEQVKAWQKVTTSKMMRQLMEKGKVFCAFKNNRLIGTIALVDNKIVSFYVSYSKRNLGIGGQLLSYLEDYAKKVGVQRLQLNSTPSAKLFYEGKGYQPVKMVIEKILGVPFEETLMEKQIGE